MPRNRLLFEGPKDIAGHPVALKDKLGRLQWLLKHTLDGYSSKTRHVQAFTIAIINIQLGYESQYQSPDKMFKVASVTGKETYEVLRDSCAPVYRSIQGWHDGKPLLVPFGPDAQYQVVPQPQFSADMVAESEVLHQGMRHGGVSNAHHVIVMSCLIQLQQSATTVMDTASLAHNACRVASVTLACTCMCNNSLLALPCFVLEVKIHSRLVIST